MKREQMAEGITLYCGDCREVLSEMRDVDAVVTDLPYGINEDYASYKDTQENLNTLITSTLPGLRALAQRVVLTSGTMSQYNYPRPDWTMCWVTPAGTGRGPWGFCCWQPILCYGKDPFLTHGMGSQPDVIMHTESSEKNGHPCPKPIRFMQLLIDRVTLANELVLDPFMGSGTTAIACINLGRRFVGIELEPKYFDIARRRIDQTIKQPFLFVDKPRKVLEGNLF